MNSQWNEEADRPGIGLNTKSMRTQWASSIVLPGCLRGGKRWRTWPGRGKQSPLPQPVRIGAIAKPDANSICCRSQLGWLRTRHWFLFCENSLGLSFCRRFKVSCPPNQLNVFCSILVQIWFELVFCLKGKFVTWQATATTLRKRVNRERRGGRLPGSATYLMEKEGRCGASPSF